MFNVGAMPVNVSVPVNISVLPADFECYGNELFLYNCSDCHSVFCVRSSENEIVAGTMCEGKSVIALLINYSIHRLA